MTFTSTFIDESIALLTALRQDDVEACAAGIARGRERGGRLFQASPGSASGVVGSSSWAWAARRATPPMP